MGLGDSAHRWLGVGWYQSGLRIEPVTEEISMAAIELLCTNRLHRDRYAIDAVVASTALRAPKPVILLTSDEDDMTTLCGKAIKVVAV